MDSNNLMAAIDLGVVAIANLVNLAMIAIFLARIRGRWLLEWRIGLAQITLVVPLSAIVALNAAVGRAWWAFALPALLTVFLLLELLLDYVLQRNFRDSWLLGPYLLLYYAALWGMIGYAFLVGTTAGIVTLVTYFAQLAATAYSYRKVGHGAPRRDARPGGAGAI